MIKDGWHDVTDGVKVYTENGMILRAITDNRSASVYKHSRGEGWDNACPMRYDTFRRGWLIGRYIIR